MAHLGLLQLLIIRNRWLTGVAAPSMQTMDVDEPMSGYGLMQAVARLNRVFRDKRAGLVVEYIGIAQNPKSARGQHSRGDRQHASVDETEAIAVMLEKYEIVCGVFHGFDYWGGLTELPKERLLAFADAIDWVLASVLRGGQRVPLGRQDALSKYQIGDGCGILPAWVSRRERAVLGREELQNQKRALIELLLPTTAYRTTVYLAAQLPRSDQPLRILSAELSRLRPLGV